MKNIAEFLASTWIHFLNAFFLALVPIVLISLISGLVVFLLVSRRGVVKISLVFSVSGSVLGLLLGSSREPSVNAFLPAIITLLSGLLVYILPKEETLRAIAATAEEAQSPTFQRDFVVASILGLMISAGMGAMWGGSVRSFKEQDNLRYEEWRTEYEKVKIPLEYRKLARDLNLPPEAAVK